MFRATTVAFFWEVFLKDTQVDCRIRGFSIRGFNYPRLVAARKKIWQLKEINLCETWSLTLREERRLRVFENRVLRRVFGPKRDEGTGKWRKLNNKELSDLYSLPNIVRVVK
jgi:hypothetical protein